jgi:hypothetical protein
MQYDAHLKTWKEWLVNEEIRLAIWLESIGVKPMIDPRKWQKTS